MLLRKSHRKIALEARRVDRSVRVVVRDRYAASASAAIRSDVFVRSSHGGSSLGLSFRGVEKESRDDYLEEASSDRTAMRFVALTDHLLDHVGNTAAPSR